MREIEPEIDRILTLLRNRIRQRGFTQMEVQDTLGWGRSYISQLLTKQKSLRVEQVLLILQVISVDPADFFAELYVPPRPRGGVGPGDPAAPAAPRWPELEELSAVLRGLVGVLVEKRLVTDSEVSEAAEDAEKEAAGGTESTRPTQGR